MGTKFIATAESLADDGFREALVAATLDDVVMTSSLSGLPANFLKTWLDSVTENVTTSGSTPAAFDQQLLLDGRSSWAAGHSVSGITKVTNVDELVHRTRQEYEKARRSALHPLTESVTLT